MKKSIKKIKLEELKVQSFITASKTRSLVGGGPPSDQDPTTDPTGPTGHTIFNCPHQTMQCTQIGCPQTTGNVTMEQHCGWSE